MQGHFWISVFEGPFPKYFPVLLGIEVSSNCSQFFTLDLKILRFDIMDPLSAAASIVGLLGAAATVTTILKAIVAAMEHTPQLVANLLIEVSDIASCLGQLQAFLTGAVATSRSRKSLLMVDQIAVALTNCVLIFSELENTVEMLKLDLPFLPRTIRLRFMAKEAAITKLLTRLNASKLSLTLMLTTLTW